MTDGATEARARLPVVDMAPLFAGGAADHGAVARAIEAACRASGFFYVTGHGITENALTRLEAASRRFFALPLPEKMEIAMAKGGAAWRGFFPVGDELTSGQPDRKEGLYFGTGLSSDHPRVRAGWPLHGANLWPVQVPELRAAVDDYMAATSRAAQVLLRGVALSLNLPADYFERTYTAEPTVLFRIFQYPPAEEDGEGDPEAWGVGEHTDYGLLTLLAQDRHGGLQVKTPGGWIEAPPIPGALVCNIGDMVDRPTGGWFRSTPHRVRNRSGHGRLSFPLFFDPDFVAELRPLPESAAIRGRGGSGTSSAPRWDGADLQSFEGTYGDYLLSKVAKVFPNLRSRVL